MLRIFLVHVHPRRSHVRGVLGEVHIIIKSSAFVPVLTLRVPHLSRQVGFLSFVLRPLSLDICNANDDALALAARVIVSRVTETFCGSSKRSSCDLQV
jgi:hypothetical protein